MKGERGLEYGSTGDTTGPGRTGAGQPSQKRVVAVIPAYNEERFIGSVVLKALRHAGHVVVVDDGSSDATAQVAEAAGALIVRHETNRGKGAALNSGFRRALQLEPDVVVTIDADGQHRPRELASVAAPVARGQADIVVGSRYLREECGTPRHRIWGHQLFNLLTRAASGVPVGDSQSGFRAFSPRALRAITFRSHGFSVESEMQFLARDYGLKILEAPITVSYQDRPKRPVLAHGLYVLNGLLQMVGQYRPLLYFGAPGAFLLLAGGILGLYIADIFGRTRQLAVGYALICVMLVIGGNMALTTGLILHSVRGMLLQYLRGGRRAGAAEKGPES